MVRTKKITRETSSILDQVGLDIRGPVNHTHFRIVNSTVLDHNDHLMVETEGKTIHFPTVSSDTSSNSVTNN